MELTREKALKICKELWTRLAQSGEEKGDCEDFWAKYGKMYNDCPFCQFGREKENSGNVCPVCQICPLMEFVGGCSSTPYSGWEDALTRIARKKYAQQFLEVLNRISVSRDGESWKYNYAKGGNQ